LGDKSISKATNVPQIESDLIWYEEFLDYKIVIGTTILIKKQSKNKQILWRSFGFHHYSNDTVAQELWKMSIRQPFIIMHQHDLRMEDIWSWGELAISTDKLHQRGPIGLQHLVTNKWYIYGEGQIR
jgi:glutamate-5-semialdehyde dehydrogenase